MVEVLNLFNFCEKEVEDEKFRFLERREREKAEVLENGLKVLKYLSEEKPILRVWKPRGRKPYMNYHYKSVESLEQHLQKNIDFYNKDLEYKAKLKADRKGSSELLEKIKVGDVFHESWGYEQTNVNYYQVLSKKGRYVEVREIGAKSVEGSEGFMSCRVVPHKGAFLKNAPVMKKLV